MACLPSCVLALMLLQYIPNYPRQRVPLPPSATGGNTAAVATFTGTFKTADKKYLTIMVEGGQTMRMYITSSTKFFRDDMPAKVTDFHADENVIVEASSDARQNLLAVRVEAKAARTSAPDKAPDSKSSVSDSK
jgi:hypothetical protein